VTGNNTLSADGGGGLGGLIGALAQSPQILQAIHRSFPASSTA
jgi:hypothetical protein